MSEKALQWHPGFQAVMQIELLDDKDYLQFEKEYNLTEKPLQMDILIIKLEKGHQIRKSIGKIFRQYNVVEYKSPTDYISINDFYRVIGYSAIFQSNTKKVLERLPEEITITFVTNKYPRKMLGFLKKRYHVRIEKAEKGIYYLHGMMFTTQVVVIPNLTKEEYIWLSRLRENLQADDAERLSQAYVGKNKDPLYAAAMDLIVKANRKVYEEARDMCEAIRELFADELAEYIRQGQEHEKRMQEYEKREQEYEKREQEYEKREQEYEKREQEYEKQVQKSEEMLFQMSRDLEAVTNQGILALIEICMEAGMGRENAEKKLIEKFNLVPEAAKKYVEKLWEASVEK